MSFITLPPAPYYADTWWWGLTREAQRPSLRTDDPPVNQPGYHGYGTPRGLRMNESVGPEWGSWRLRGSRALWLMSDKDVIIEQ